MIIFLEQEAKKCQEFLKNYYCSCWKSDKSLFHHMLFHM